MFTRRQLRIKAMQTLYASYVLQEAEEEVAPDYKLSEKQLFNRIHNAYQLYLYSLFLVGKVAEYLEVREDILASKILPSSQEKKINKKLLENPVTQALINFTPLFDGVEQETLKPHYDRQIIKSIYADLTEREKYNKYLEESGQEDQHKNILNYLYYRVMLPNTDFQQHIESIWLTWLDDLPVVSNWVRDTLYNIQPDKPSPVPLVDPYAKNWEAQRQFVRRLVLKTLDNRVRFEKMIAGKAQNWDVERITFLDRTLMQMCLTELLYCPTIPVKVSIDEYIEIAKNYSTPKSRGFINGILDRLMRQLEEDGKIKKEGKGKE